MLRYQQNELKGDHKEKFSEVCKPPSLVFQPPDLKKPSQFLKMNSLGRMHKISLPKTFCFIFASAQTSLYRGSVNCQFISIGNV